MLFQRVRKEGSAGSSFSYYQYPDYSYDDYCIRSSMTYQITEEVQNCELVNLADLKTETADVLGKISSYLVDLVNGCC